MNPAAAPRRNGFTLVEMLVALVIFALLAAGGVGLLRASVSTQESVDAGLSRLSAKERVIALFQADAGQAIARPLSGVGEARQLPFEGTSDRLTMVRSGWANPGEQPRSGLQRVEWSMIGGNVTRTAHVSLETIDPGQPASLQSNARQLTFRYRRNDGGWTDSFRSTAQELLPAAVEMTVAPQNGQALVVVVALPPRGPEPKAAAAAGPGQPGAGQPGAGAP